MPLIGITAAQDDSAGRISLSEGYFRAVAKAGGTPVVLPPLPPAANLAALVKNLDGLILSGGGDVDPVYFGEEPLSGTGAINPERDDFEIRLARWALLNDLPVLGICRGMQVINIAAGGDICQDIAQWTGKPLKHSQEAPRWYPTHEISIISGSRLATILQTERLRVNSFHHQVIRRVAPGWRAVAWSKDGVLEAIEGPGLFTVGVQWHPETMWERYPVFLNLFRALVNASSR
ncbi:MAG: gamma-glutamyl-gamma-aminobutyrate hydrolase family protein [Peptococcaceae bacterium]|nr:gamma-glutamyl-gamma-aminobutyrate hydrolase family protein [Peptococcaceae bacterium]